MIIPTLHIDGDEACIHLVDPAYPHKSYAICQMETNDDTVELFFELLTTVLEAYDNGYSAGYDNAIQDFEEGGGLDVEI
jgi:hypothetical protein